MDYQLVRKCAEEFEPEEVFQYLKNQEDWTSVQEDGWVDYHFRHESGRIVWFRKDASTTDLGSQLITIANAEGQDMENLKILIKPEMD